MKRKTVNKITWWSLTLAYAVCFTVLILLFSACPKVDPEPSEHAILALVNDARTKGCNCGDETMPPVGKLSWNNLAEKAAQRHSDDMRKNNFTDHVGSDGSLFWERLSDTGFKWTSCGENIAWGFPTEEEVFDAWMKSPCHCKNIMGDFEFIGVARSGDYWTMVLAK